MKKLFAIIILAIFPSLSFAASNPANIPSVPNIATLQALGQAAPLYPVVNVVSYTTGNVGGGIFSYASTCPTSTDGGFYIAITSGPVGSCYARQRGPVTSVLEFGAKGDGSTDDTTRIQAALNAVSGVGGGTLSIPSSPSESPYLVLGQLSVPANVTVSCQSTELDWNYPGSTGLTAALITMSGNNSSIRGCKLQSLVPGISGFTCYMVNYGNNVDNTTISDTQIIGVSGVGCNDVNINGTSITNVHLTNVTVQYGGYGVIVNSSATGSGLFINNFVCSAVASDCVEFNTTSNGFTNITMSGGQLNSNLAGPVTASGFCIGLAGALDVSITGVTITGCRREAIHVELGGPSGTQRRVSIIGNIIKQTNTGQNGIVLTQGTGTPTGATIPFGQITVKGNNLEANASTQASPVNTGVGIAMALNGNTDQASSVVIEGNTITNFSTGMSLFGKNNVANNIINLLYDGTTPVIGLSFPTSAPDNYALPSVHDNTVGFNLASGVSACPQLSGSPPFANYCIGVQWGRGGIIGPLTIVEPSAGVASCSMPSAVSLSTQTSSVNTNTPGIIRGVTLKGCWTHASGTDTTPAANSVPSPTRYTGLVHLHINNNSSYSTNYAHIGFYEQYTGSADNILSGTSAGTAAGTFSAPTMVMTGGTVLIGITSTTTGQTNYIATFDGDWFSQ